MFRKQDFKKVDLLGSGKKNTKIYKAEHIPTGKYYAIKEVEAKTLDKLNEYKVSNSKVGLFNREFFNIRKKQCNCSRCRAIRTCCNSLVITSTRQCTTRTASRWFVSTWTAARTLSTCSASESLQERSGLRMSLKR